MNDSLNPGWPSTSPIVIAQAMRIRAVASKDGAGNQPPARQTNLSQFELQIIGHFMSLVAEARAFAESVWQRKRQPIESLNPAAIAADLAGISQRIEVESAELRNTHKVTLQNRFKDWKTASAELQGFRIREKREGAPHYPDNKWPYYALFSVVFLIEAIMNANFYAQGSSLGLIGGLIAALVVACVFLLLAKFLCFSLQQIWLVEPFRKALGLLLCLGLLLITVAAALLAGHYRTAASVDPRNAESIAWESFLSAPFELGGFSSFLLTVLSLLICAGYVLLFFKLDDPYPGYGSRARKEALLRQQYEDELIELTKEIGKRRTQIEASIRSVEARIQSSRNIALTPPDPDPVIRQYEIWVKTAENDCQSVLSQYRQYNSQVRSEAEPPYFSELFRFPDNQTSIHLTGKDRLNQLCEEAEQELRALATGTADLVTKSYKFLNPDLLAGQQIDA